MVRVFIGFTVVALSLAGCGRGNGKPSADGSSSGKAAPVDRMADTREGMHQGAFQLGNAATDLESAIEAAKKLQASTKNVELKAALGEALSSLDDAGSNIGDFTGEPPELDKFKLRFSEEDKRRLDSIDAANDALHDVNDAEDSIGDYTDHPAAGDSDGLDDVSSALDDATDDLTDAIHSLGGKVETDDTEDVTPPTTPGTPPGL